MAQEAISANEIQTQRIFLNSLLDADILFDDLVVSVANLEYQGFDPLRLLALMRRYATTAGLNEDDHRRNVLTLATLGTMRGSSLEKIKGKSTDELKRFLVQMERIYKVKGGTPRSNNDITLIRISACFAAVMSKGLASGNLQVTTTVNPMMVAPGFPNFMCLSTFGSLLPIVHNNGLNEEDARKVYRAFCWHQKLFDEIINSQNRNRTPAATLEKFVNIQYSSTLYNVEQRDEHGLTVGLLIRSGARLIISATYRPALTAASELWTAHVGE